MAKSKQRATEEALGELHLAICKTLTAALRNPEGADPRILKEAREFLKDNKITCDVDEGNPLDFLSDSLPFDDEATKNHLQ